MSDSDTEVKPGERAAIVAAEAKRWAAEGKHFLHAGHLVVAKAKRVYSGKDGDFYVSLRGNTKTMFTCPVLETEDGQTFVITASTCDEFVPLSREMLAFFESMQSGVAGLLMVGAKALAQKKMDPTVGLRILEAAMTSQIRAMKAVET